MAAATRSGLALLTGGVACVGIAYAGAMVSGAAPVWAPWLVAVGGSAASVSLFVLGAATRRAAPRGVATLLGVLFIVLVASFGAALALGPREGPGGVLFLGLPLRLALVFYGVGCLPLLVLPITFAMTFGRGEDGGDAAGSGSEDMPADAARTPDPLA